MSTRKRRAFPNISTPRKSDLPPPRKGKAAVQRKTTPPFSSIQFNTFVYIISGLALAFITFNAWRMLQWKTAAGGWWNLALGRRPPDSPNTGAHSHEASGTGGTGDGGNVEDRIKSLAEALGLPSHELASAIADAVKNHAPPASLSSISAAEATHSETTVRALSREDEEAQSGMSMRDTLSAFAGFDDPLIMD